MREREVTVLRVVIWQKTADDDWIGLNFVTVLLHNI